MLYERMIRPSWGWWCLVKRRMPWWSCVCGPSNVLLHELAIYCDYTWYNIHTYIQAELLFSGKQKTAFRPYSFFANVKEPRSDKEICYGAKEITALRPPPPNPVSSRTGGGIHFLPFSGLCTAHAQMHHLPMLHIVAYPQKIVLPIKIIAI